MRYPSETHDFKPNYTLPTLADGLGFVYSRYQRQGTPYMEIPAERIECDDFKYSKDVSLLYKEGATELYLLPLMVYLTQNLPACCNVNNVQNYSELSKDTTYYSSEEIIKTLRSIGLPPKKLFARFEKLLREHCIILPGNDYINHLTQAFIWKTQTNEDFIISTKPGMGGLARGYDRIWLELLGPEQNLQVTLHDIFHGRVNYRALTSHLYYILYKSWFDETSTIPVESGARIYIAHHTVYDEMRISKPPTDLTIHPSKFLKSFMVELATKIDKENKSDTYPVEFESIISEPIKGVRQILSTLELQSEGKYMRHCVGGDRYLGYLISGSMIYFHLDIPDTTHGATLSLRRADLSSYDGCYRLKGSNSLEWWTIDQFYGYRDESMSYNDNALEVRNALLETHFDMMSVAEYTELLKEPEKLLAIKQASSRLRGRSLLNDLVPWNLADVPDLSNAFDRRQCGMVIPNNEREPDLLVETTTALTRSLTALAGGITPEDTRRALEAMVQETHPQIDVEFGVGGNVQYKLNNTKKPQEVPETPKPPMVDVPNTGGSGINLSDLQIRFNR